MVAGLVLLFGYVAAVWLVFFKFRWLKFSIPWGVVSFGFGLHILIIFLIGLRFVTPYSTDAKIIQHTIQLVPRLPEPTLVTAVLVEPNVPVKKGQALFQFDRRPYEYKVRQLEAQLAQSNQNVQVMKADTEAAADEGRRDSRASSSTPRTSRSSPPISPRTAPAPRRTRRNGRRRWRPTGRPSRRPRRTSCARSFDTRRRSAASTRRWRRFKPSSTRHAITSTTP